MVPSGAVGRETVLRVSAPAGRGEAILAAVRDAASVPAIAVGPSGIHGFDPLVLATHGRRTAFFPACSPDRAREVATALDGGQLPEDAAHVVTHDPETDTLPVPDTGPLATGRRRALARCGWVDPTAPDDYGEPPTAPDEGLVAAAAEVGLLGRGRGDAWTDEPIAAAWQTARESEGDPVVVVNANEADPRVAGDRVLLEGTPIDVLDAASAVAHAVAATDIVVYCNESEGTVADRVRAAIESCGERLAVETTVATGPDRYIAGEETMALESLEGNDRLEARLRPPSPAEHGLYGRPTLVHTPRTLAQVWALLERPEEFDADTGDPGTRLVSVTGAVETPATVELPTSGSLSVATAAVDHRELKFACVGGRFGGVTRDLAVSPAAPSMDAAGLGTNGAVELFTDDACTVATVGDRARGASEDNCGRCVPCREGSKQLTDLLRAVYDGEFDADGIRELTRVMRASSTCAFGRDAARTVTTAMERFETEFRAHAEGRCPAGTCTTER